MRLDKYLADMSLGTRSEVKKMIVKGRVKVNNTVIKNSNYKIGDEDKVYFDDELVEYVEYEYYILNKPKGYLCTSYDKKDPIIMDLIQAKRKDLVPVGRLDKDSEGLILITNDGILNHNLLSPNKHVNKKYYVELDKDIPYDAGEVFSKPMDLGDFISKPAKYEKITNRSAFLTIAEGKFHQVKRMFEKIGTNVIYLKRVEFKNLKLDGLEVGDYRALTNEEITLLKNED